MWLASGAQPTRVERHRRAASRASSKLSPLARRRASQRRLTIWGRWPLRCFLSSRDRLTLTLPSAAQNSSAVNARSSRPKVDVPSSRSNAARQSSSR